MGSTPIREVPFAPGCLEVVVVHFAVAETVCFSDFPDFTFTPKSDVNIALEPAASYLLVRLPYGLPIMSSVNVYYADRPESIAVFGEVRILRACSNCTVS